MTEKQFIKLVKDAQAKATNKNSLRCKIGFHDFRILAESGFIMSKVFYSVCTRCGRYHESGLGVEGYC